MAKEKTYGLPDLSYEIAAQVLGVTETEVIRFVHARLLNDNMKSERSRWALGRRPLPERLIRLWIIAHRAQLIDGGRPELAALDPASDSA